MNKNEAVAKIAESMSKENVELVKKDKHSLTYNLRTLSDNLASEPYDIYSFIIALIRSFGGIALIAFAIDTIRVCTLK